MILTSETREAAWATRNQLSSAGLSASEPKRGLPRGSRKYWWMVETVDSEIAVIRHLLAGFSSTRRSLSVQEEKLQELRRDNARAQREWDAAIASIDSTLKPFLSGQRQEAEVRME